MNTTWQRLTAALALILATSVGIAATPDSVRESAPQSDTVTPQIWRVDGGDMRMRFNESFLELFGVGVDMSSGVLDTQTREFGIFPLIASGGLKLNAPDGSFDRFLDGGLQLRGGFELTLKDGSRIDLRDAKIRASADNPARLELVGADGEAWVYVNHLMYEFLSDYRVFSVRTADLRASALLAKRVGDAALIDAYIGEVQLKAAVIARSREMTPRPKGNATPNFHGTVASGITYQADVLLFDYSMSFMRCRRSNGTTNGCDGVGGDDGEVVFAPSATLLNTNNANTADVPWYEKFTTSPWSYPYMGNDQHPYLVWNMFRIVDGQLEQIGVSGTKHAFLTTNSGQCSNAFGNHVLNKNCSDTYGTGNNDNARDLGPRSEILPASGQWGRCGSIFDTNCDGGQNNVPGCTSSAADGCYSQRLRVRESQLAVAGAQYWTESWYVVLEDINIYNTMGRRTITPSAGGGGWAPGSQSGFTRGPVINDWVDPVANPTRNVELASSAGRARVAVKTKLLNACPAASGLVGTCYRYDYAVHNFDFATAESTSGTPPNFRVTGAKGFNTFKIATSARTSVYLEPEVNFADNDINPANNWTGSVTPGAVEWTAPADNALNWGTLYRFSVISDVTPSSDVVSIDLGIANPQQGVLTLSNSIVGPAGLGNGIMKNGFE